jgi:mRNA interferase MazF
MRRGDFVTIALNGDFGKARPALIIQSDQFDAHATVTVVLVSPGFPRWPSHFVTTTFDSAI